MFAMLGARALGFAYGMLIAQRDVVRYASWLVAMIIVQALDWVATLVALTAGKVTLAQVSTAPFLPILFVAVMAAALLRGRSRRIAEPALGGAHERLRRASFRPVAGRRILSPPPCGGSRGRRPRHGKDWLDIGCGPGLLTQIAARAGYDALGVDRDPDRIAAARRLSAERGASARFEQADLETLAQRGERFDVVSASSLLVVLADPAGALRRLVGLTKAGGAVLVIEAAEAMSIARAGRLSCRAASGDAVPAVLWAYVRTGRTLDWSAFDQPDLHLSRFRLLTGLVEVNLVTPNG